MRALLAVSLLSLSSAGQVRSSDLAVAVSPACAITDVSTTIASSREGSLSQIAGVTRFRYLLRTGKRNGGAEIRFHFSPASPGSSTRLRFFTNLGGTGTPLSGNNIAVSSPILAATFGSNAHTSGSGESGAIEWTWQGSASALQAGALAPALTIVCH